MFPIFLEMAGRRAVVIGGGAVAVRKAQSLLDAGARVVVIAEDANEAMTNLSASNPEKLELVRSPYSKEYLAGAVLAVAATDKPQVNRQVYKDCQQLEVLCNVVDDPGMCDFHVPAVVRRGHLQLAVGTEGNCPAYSGHIRRRLEEIFTEDHGRFLAELERFRSELSSSVGNATQRKAILGNLVEDASFRYFMENGPDRWRNYAERTSREDTGA